MNKNDEKYFQLNDRIEMINDTKKLLDNNLSITNNNLNIFISEVKKKFEGFKKLKKEKITKIYQLNSINKYNFNSSSQNEINNENNYYSNSNSKEKYTNNNILNNYQYNNNKMSNTDNFMYNLKQSYFNSIIPDESYFFNCKSDDNIFNDNNQYKHISPKTSFYFNKNRDKYKRIYLNRSQELIPTKNIGKQSFNNISRNKHKVISTIYTSKNNSCKSYNSPNESNRSIKYSSINNNCSINHNDKNIN